MGSERFEMRVPEDLLRRLDEARGHEKRASFIKRALESALGAGGVAGTSGVVRSHRRGDEQAPSANTSAEVPSAPSRASAKPVPGVRPAREFVLDPRQALVNADRERKAKKA